MFQVCWFINCKFVFASFLHIHYGLYEDIPCKCLEVTLKTTVWTMPDMEFVKVLLPGPCVTSVSAQSNSGTRCNYHGPFPAASQPPRLLSVMTDSHKMARHNLIWASSEILNDDSFTDAKACQCTAWLHTSHQPLLSPSVFAIFPESKHCPSLPADSRALFLYSSSAKQSFNNLKIKVVLGCAIYLKHHSGSETLKWEGVENKRHKWRVRSGFGLRFFSSDGC